MAGHHDARLLYSVGNIQAYHIQDGQEQALTPSGPQTLRLLMMPTSNPFADLSTIDTQNDIPEEDFYLHMQLPPELDLPMPATTQVYHKPPRSYLIPRWDLGADRGAFTRIEFPEKVSQDDIDTFETILAQCTAFLERAPPPTGDKMHKAYNPADWAPGGPLGGGKTEAGHIVLVDEEDGSIVGELGEGAQVIEDSKLAHGSKSPVEVEISEDGQHVSVRPVSEDYLRMAKHPAYKDSSLVQNAASASRLIVTSSGYLGNLLSSGADNFTQKVKPNPKPLTFSPGAQERIRKLHSFTDQGATLSAKTVGSATKYAQNISATLARKGNRKDKGFDKDGKPIETYRPGFLNKSMIAFSTIADGVAESGRSLLTQSSQAATTVVQHRYGPEAGKVAGQLAGGVKNVGLVYIDVTGVSRRAVIKSVAKGMVVGKVKGGGEVVVGGGDGGAIPDEDIRKAAGTGQPGVQNSNLHVGDPGIAGFGAGAGAGSGPPAYADSELGETVGSLDRKQQRGY
ncbi:MAG: hypothetical protein M1828_003531 [Chrysothrix sp. TS-e1954]|nr:MAG: hypothetical protein M1828_003531 [Chrysothrix sp. TS-e1954]